MSKRYDDPADERVAAGRTDDAIECRLQPIGDGEWAEVYAQAGPNFPSYTDEQWIGDAPMEFLRKRSLVDGDVSPLSASAQRVVVVIWCMSTDLICS